jgi:hypothetical protein
MRDSRKFDAKETANVQQQIEVDGTDGFFGAQRHHLWLRCDRTRTGTVVVWRLCRIGGIGGIGGISGVCRICRTCRSNAGNPDAIAVRQSIQSQHRAAAERQIHNAFDFDDALDSRHTAIGIRRRSKR